MGIEYERKYLVTRDDWRSLIRASESITQGYIAVTATSNVRVRLKDEFAYLTVKSAKMVASSRIEVECEISPDDGRQLLETLCSGVVGKVRHTLEAGPGIWTVDVFDGANAGLILLEVESDKPFDMHVLPSWVGAEVTHDERYQNSYLSQLPYTTWPSAKELRNDS